MLVAKVFRIVEPGGNCRPYWIEVRELDGGRLVERVEAAYRLDAFESLSKLGYKVAEVQEHYVVNDNLFGGII